MELGGARCEILPSYCNMNILASNTGRCAYVLQKHSLSLENQTVVVELHVICTTGNRSVGSGVCSWIFRWVPENLPIGFSTRMALK